MSNQFRLPEPYGLLLDRKRKVAFTFDGNEYTGYHGDTIASALAANGQMILSRSFKYHRPRAALTYAGQDSNSLVQLPSNPNALADREPIIPSLQITAQNYSGSLENDRDAWIGRIAKFLPVGFYYRAFFKPKGAWEIWSRFIRKKAGLGIIDKAHKPEYFDKQYLFYDVVVVGAGPAGLSAAISAADVGADVLIIDENAILGGSLNYARIDANGTRTGELRRALTSAVEKHQKIDIMVDTICNGWFADNWLPLINGNRLYKTRAGQVLLCTGVMEQPAIFRNNDLPGVLLGSAAQRILHLYGVKPGSNAVILAGNNDGYGVALDLLDAGVNVELIVDLRMAPEFDEIATTVVDHGIRILQGHAIYAAIASKGNRHIRAVDVRPIISDGVCSDKSEIIRCDMLCMSVGFVPAYQLACQAGGRLDYDDEKSVFTLTNLPLDCQVAGSVAGLWDIDDVIDNGKFLGKLAGSADQVLIAAKSTTDKKISSTNYSWPIFPHPKGKEFVDFDEDLQIADIVNAVHDGYEHIQLVKRYSTCGMGPSQGRHSALATARLVAKETNKSVAETGVTTSRPPFAAEKLAHVAGRAFYPARRSNMHHRHIEAGAQMLHAGTWYRPAYYGSQDLKTTAIRREVENVRNNVGIVDVSTLGGLDIRGPDAGEFLNRIYTFGFLKQPIGHSRYALMTNETGAIIDDGVACRLDEHHYYVTTTTGSADSVFHNMLKWNAQWNLDVDISNVTSALCGVNISGPNARTVLRLLCTDVDLDRESFPYMGIRVGTVAEIPARIIRVGFVGELGYEIHVPQHCGEALWDAAISAGSALGIAPFGIEAQRILRLEKGHIIIGQDTDAMSNPMEVQMDWAISKAKPFYVGGRTIVELKEAKATRHLVGFVVRDPEAPLPLECQLVVDNSEVLGRVTSCEYSPTLEKTVGLAYVPPGIASPGKQFTIKGTGGVEIAADVVMLPFYDPENLRQEL